MSDQSAFKTTLKRSYTEPCFSSTPIRSPKPSYSQTSSNTISKYIVDDFETPLQQVKKIEYSGAEFDWGTSIQTDNTMIDHFFNRFKHRNPTFVHLLHDNNNNNNNTTRTTSSTITTSTTTKIANNLFHNLNDEHFSNDYIEQYNTSYNSRININNNNISNNMDLHRDTKQNYNYNKFSQFIQCKVCSMNQQSNNYYCSCDYNCTTLKSPAFLELRENVTEDQTTEEELSAVIPSSDFSHSRHSSISTRNTSGSVSSLQSNDIEMYNNYNNNINNNNNNNIMFAHNSSSSSLFTPSKVTTSVRSPRGRKRSISAEGSEIFPRNEGNEIKTRNRSNLTEIPQVNFAMRRSPRLSNETFSPQKRRGVSFVAEDEDELNNLQSSSCSDAGGSRSQSRCSSNLENILQSECTSNSLWGSPTGNFENLRLTQTSPPLPYLLNKRPKSAPPQNDILEPPPAIQRAASTTFAKNFSTFFSHIPGFSSIETPQLSINRRDRAGSMTDNENVPSYYSSSSSSFSHNNNNIIGTKIDLDFEELNNEIEDKETDPKIQLLFNDPNTPKVDTNSNIQLQTNIFTPTSQNLTNDSIPKLSNFLRFSKDTSKTALFGKHN